LSIKHRKEDEGNLVLKNKSYIVYNTCMRYIHSFESQVARNMSSRRIPEIGSTNDLAH
jgi:hypothetical protein